VLGVEEIAGKLGHDVTSLRAGQEIRSTVQVNSLDELKQLFDHGEAPEQRATVAQTIGADRPEHADPENDSLDAVTHRVEAHVLGDAPISDADRQRVAAAFPMHVTAISAPDKTLGPGEVWDLGTSTSAVTVNLGTLTMQPGSAIKIQNTVLSFTVATLVRNAGTGGAANYDIGIFGATGGTGTAGTQGGAGGPGGTGNPGTCQSGGGISGNDGGVGGVGSAGATGGVGGVGNDGLPALSATIKVGSLTGSAGQLVVATQSGTGGYGGPGGTGGAGGSGGHGGDGANCGCEGTNGGSGGQGGHGGAGGTGGTGGSGVSGSNVYVTVPSGQTNMIVRVRNPAPSGPGGTGGAGGGQGTGGSGGSAGKHQSSGGSGSAGSPGAQGNPGPAGAQSGAPGLIYVNGSGS
jgi:hypothetical protein